MSLKYIRLHPLKIPGQLLSKTSWERMAGQHATRRKLSRLAFLLFLFYMACKNMHPSLQIFENIESSKGIEGKSLLDSLAHTLFHPPAALADSVIQFDLKGTHEDHLRALARLKRSHSSCTRNTGTCVGIFMMVNRGAIDLFRNFLYFLEKLNLKHYDFIVCTSDDEVSSLALLNKHRVIMVKNHEIEDDRLDFGTPNYQMAMSLRTRIINVLLQTKLYDYWLISDTDAVWLCDPFEEIFDLDFLSEPFDVGGQLDGPRICGGFLVLRSSPKVQHLWNEVMISYEHAVKTSSVGKGIEKTEQGILNDLISNDKLGLRVKGFSKELFPSGLNYFEEGVQEKACVVHNNYIIGIEKKVERFKAFNLWMVGSNIPNGK